MITHGGDIFDLEAKVVDAGLKLRPFDFTLRTDRDDRQVDVAVGEISRRADAVNYLQTEALGVKLHELVHVFREYCEMTNACHDESP